MFEKLKVKKAAKRRDHQLSAEEELLLLQCGSDELIRHYIHKYSFREESEGFMLDNSSNAVLRSYFNRYAVSPEREYRVLEKDDGLPVYYIERHGLQEKGRKALLLSGNEWLCDYYVETGHHFRGDDETLFIENASNKLIESYIKKYDLSLPNLQTLCKKNAKWLLVYAKTQKLPEEFEVDFIRAASDEEFAEYIKENSLSLEACLILLEPENKEKLRRYISKHSLVSDYPLDDPTAEEKLFQSKDMDLIREYIKFHGSEISEAGELELFELDDKELIKHHIDLNGLYDFSETILMEPGNEEIFKYYAEKCYFSENNQLELLRRGNKELIATYIEHNSLCLEAEKLLMLTRDKELIKNYHKKWQLNDSSWKLLLETFLIDNI